MEKILGPTGKHHSGPDNKAVGNGRNGVTAENGDKILKNLGQAAAEAGKTAAKGKLVTIGETTAPVQTDKKGMKYALSMLIWSQV